PVDPQQARRRAAVVVAGRDELLAQRQISRNRHGSEDETAVLAGRGHRQLVGVVADGHADARAWGEAAAVHRELLIRVHLGTGEGDRRSKSRRWLDPEALLTVQLRAGRG